jgi:hypothetical protein
MKRKNMNHFLSEAEKEHGDDCQHEDTREGKVLDDQQQNYVGQFSFK